MLREIKSWAALAWEWSFFRGTPERLPKSVTALVVAALLYALLSYLSERFVHPMDASTLLVAALIDTGFSIGFLGFFILVREPARFLPSVFMLLSIGIVLTVPTLALASIQTLSVEWEGLKDLLLTALFIYSVLAQARVLMLSSRFPMAFSVLVIVAYILADEVLVDRWLGVTS
jgi:predicted aspartyl protease